MTRNKRRAAAVRWAMLVVGVVLLVAGLGWILCPLVLDDTEVGAGLLATPLLLIFGWMPQERWQYGVDVALLLGLLLLLQWMFLRPRKQWSVRAAAQGRPMKSAILAAACMAMLLSVGAIATLLEIPGWWDWVYEASSFDGEENAYLWPVWLVMAGVWGVWGVVFFIYWRQGDRYTQLGRMVRGLLAGSVLEMMIAAPVHAMTYQRGECYCTRGGYTGLVFGGTVLIWCFGPGVALLFLRERYRAAARHCAGCGYDLRGSITTGNTHCPECGEMIHNA